MFAHIPSGKRVASRRESRPWHPILLMLRLPTAFFSLKGEAFNLYFLVSLAVLGDEKKKWRPRKYSYSRWGCKLTLKFPIVKLLDYDKNWELLAENNNPFAVVIMAYLKSKETRTNPVIRLESK